MFTRQNTYGFSDADLALLNEAAKRLATDTNGPITIYDEIDRIAASSDLPAERRRGKAREEGL